MEDNGVFTMNVANNKAFIYIKDNEARHVMAGYRALAGIHTPNISRTGFPKLEIAGRLLPRTWSLLARPVRINDTSIYLIHNVADMGWKVGDRIAIAPTVAGNNAQDAQSFWILAISGTRIDLAADDALGMRAKSNQVRVAMTSRVATAATIAYSDFRRIIWLTIPAPWRLKLLTCRATWSSLAMISATFLAQAPITAAVIPIAAGLPVPLGSIP
jgi:hypothetical protein